MGSGCVGGSSGKCGQAIVGMGESADDAEKGKGRWREVINNE